MPRVKFAEWTPDLPPDDENYGTDNIFNVMPTLKGYKGINVFSAYTTTELDTTCKGGFHSRDRNGVDYIIFGSKTALYRQDIAAATLTDVSIAGGYGLDEEEYWDFCDYSYNIIATNPDSTLQYFDMGVSTDFDDVPNAPDGASCCATIREFIVLGDIFVGASRFPNRLKWCASGDITNWTAGSNESDEQDLHEGGVIRRIIGGEYGIVIQDKGFTRMTRIGGGPVFQLDRIEACKERGTPAARSVVKAPNGIIYYYDHDGFAMFDGQQCTLLGDNKWNQTVRDLIDPGELPEGAIGNIIGSYDPVNKVIWWIFNSDNSDPDNPRTDGVIFHIASGKLAPFTMAGDNAVGAFNLDFLFPAVYNTHFGSGLQAGRPVMWAVGNTASVDHTPGFLTGGYGENSHIETAEFGEGDKRLNINGATLLGSRAMTGELSLGSSESPGAAEDDIDYTTPVLPVEYSYYSVLANGKFIRARLSEVGQGLSSGEATGVNLILSEDGEH